MPYRKKNYRKKGKGKGKRRYNRKKKYNKATFTRMKSPGFSDSMFVRLKYSEDIHINDGVSASKLYTYRGNSLFDPNLTGVGHQPMYFDQYALIYEKYRVMGAKISIRAINGTSSVAQYLILEAGTDQNLSNNVTRLLEQSRSSISRIVPAYSQSPTYIKRYTSTRKACGLTKSQIYDADFGADTTGSPQQLWYFNIIAAAIDSLSPADLYLMVSITYYCQFYDRKIQDQS